MEETSKLSIEEIRILRDFLNLGRALTSSLTSSQITCLASALGEIVPLLQALGHPGIRKLFQALIESSDALADMVGLVATYHKAGTVRNGLELVTLLGVVREALSAPAVVRLAETGNAVMLTGDKLAAMLGGMEGIQGLSKSAEEACEETTEDRSTIGILGLLKALKEPQVQRGIKFLIHFVRKIDEQRPAQDI